MNLWFNYSFLESRIRVGDGRQQCRAVTLTARERRRGGVGTHAVAAAKIPNSLSAVDSATKRAGLRLLVCPPSSCMDRLRSTTR